LNDVSADRSDVEIAAIDRSIDRAFEADDGSFLCEESIEGRGAGLPAQKEAIMIFQSDQEAGHKFVVTNTLIVRDVQRSVAFYRDVLGATVLREGEPTFLRLGNIWLTINVGGGPTDRR
jgi:Glyoxalase/Bleomycin resistance protein/Dioxygenase superfamily